MKQDILFYFVCILGITIAGNATNKTLSTDNDISISNDDEDFYTVDVLLTADGVSTPRIE